MPRAGHHSSPPHQTSHWVKDAFGQIMYGLGCQVGVSVAVGAAVSVGVGVSVGVNVGVGVSVGVGVGVSVGVRVGVSVTLAVCVAAKSTREPQAPETRANRRARKIMRFFIVMVTQSQGVVKPWNSLYTSGRLSLE